MHARCRRILRGAARDLIATLLLLGAIVGCNGAAPLVPDPAVRYIAFGDSSTSGRAARNYPQILGELLGEPPDALANEGADGEATADGLERMRRLLSRGLYPNAATLLYWQGGADMVAFMRDVDRLLLFSPTDANYPFSARLREALDRVQTNVETALTEARAAGLTVYTATYFSLREAPAPCDPLPLDFITATQARHANAYVALLNERIRQAAANTGATLVDVASLDPALHADAANFVNCNHLSDRGNELVAELFAAALR